ncbi:MAG: PAS domain-containing protein [Desulfovibrionaceae bacterium]|nr:PAS domain-containing protein [Desulfovibrionaceae bacterium]MBF0512859.1 PAS domain-containing protein [Desulfovibrionaceae bacterium]
MRKSSNISVAADALRRKPEQLPSRRNLPAPLIGPEPNAHRLLHELQVHQVELEMQNEELSKARDELETLRARYFDLFELAPVGYLTLGEQGLIVEANLSAATLLGLARGELIAQPLNRFVHDAKDRDFFHLLHKQLAGTGAVQLRDLRMMKNDKTAFWAHVSARCIYSDPGQAGLILLRPLHGKTA